MALIVLNDVVDVKIDVYAHKHCDTSLYVEKLNGETLWSLTRFYLAGIEVYDGNHDFIGSIYDGHTILRCKRFIVENNTALNGDDHLGITLKVYL